jgi:hypothetical protein
VDQPGEANVELHRLASIVGKLVDAESGQPITKFNIKKHRSNRTSQEREQGFSFGSKSDAFRLEGLNPETKETLIISANGYPVQYFDDIAASSDAKAEPITLQLSKNPPEHVRVAGRIVDANGKPIGGVELRAISYLPPDRLHPRELRFNWGMFKSGQLEIQGYVRAIESTRAAADGAFAFASLRGPDIDLCYFGPGVPQSRFQNICEMAADQREHMELTIAPPGKLGGRINRTT